MATAVYLTYRLFWTMNLASAPAAAFSSLLLAAEFYAGVSLGLYLFQVWRLVEPPLRQPTTGHSVDVFVATYNEDVALLRGTLVACLAMDYPHTTYVLDDGARDEVRQLAESLGVRYISRTDRKHAKAGNLNNAMRRTNGEFVVVLDADHVPYPHYISRLIGYFDDPRMGFVQTPHTTYNLDNFLGRWKASSRAYWEDVRIFFEAVQLGKNRYGVACFCGSAAIIRRKALEDAGLFATETITEDLHTGMRINAAGWKSIAVSEEMVVGLAPDDAAVFASQRLRWGEGNLSILAYDNPLTMKGLTISGRINYFASIASWTFGPARVILYLTPLVMLLSGIAPVANLNIAYVTIVGCYLLSVWAGVKIASNGCGQFLGIELAMMASFPLQLQALWRAVFRRRRQEFVVSRKRGESRQSPLLCMWPQAALVAVSIVAVSWAVSRVAFGISGDYIGLGIGSSLAAYHSWLALTVMGRAARKRNHGDQWRHPVSLAVDYTIGGVTNAAVSLEFNENGCRLLTWERLEQSSPLEATLHSPVGDMICHGRVVASTPLGRPKPFAYLNDILFKNANPSQSEKESDSLRRIALQYVVPVVTMAHRLVRRGRLPTPEGLSGESNLPIPLTIDADLPNMAVRKAVALSLSNRGFFATLEYACPVGKIVKVTLSTPLGPILAQAKVRDVESIRVGSAIVYQNEFHWLGTSPIRSLMSKRRRWVYTINKTISRLRTHRQSLARIAALQLAACLLVGLTVLTYWEVKQDDILLAIATRGPIEAGERDEMKSNLERLAQYPKASNDLLLRIYKAADALAAHEPAEEAARRLADRLEDGRLAWMLTSARQLMQNRDYHAANAAFDKVLLERPEREFSLEERAEIYIEAAQAAAALDNLQKAIALYDESFNLQSPDDKTKCEYSGVLVKAGRYDQAVAVIEPLKDVESRLMLASILETQGQHQRALSVLLNLEKEQTIDDNVKQSIARLLLADRKYDVAAERLIDLLKKQSEDQQLRRMFIDAVAASSRRSDAVRQTMVDVFQKYQETGFQSFDAEGCLRLGDALRQLELYKEACIVLAKAVAEYPDNKHLRLRLAQTLASLGRYDQADAQYKILLDSMPSPSR